MRPPRSARFAVAIVAIAVAAGPLMAGATIAVFSVIAMATTGTFDWYGAGSYSLLMIGVAYFIGWPMALGAGLLVAMWSLKRTVGLWAVVAASAIAAFVFELVADARDIKSGDWDMFTHNFPVSLALAVWASLLCWLIIGRRLARAYSRPAADAQSLTAL